MKADAIPPAAESTTDSGYDTRELVDLLLDHIPDRIYFKDRQSRFIRVSRAKAERHGISNPLDLIGKTDFDLFTEEHARAAFQDEQRIIGTGEAITGKVEKETLPDGSVRWALTTKMPLRNTLGEIIGTCGISKDVTAMKAMEDALGASNAELAQTLGQLKAAQTQLIEAEKLQSEARLVAGLAHEVRNPLNILNTGIEYLAAEPAIAQDATIGMVMLEMREAVRRADAVICALMDSSQTSGLRLQEMDIHPLLESALALLQNDLSRRGIVVTKDYSRDLALLKLDPNKIETVFSGLLGNAMEAIDEKSGTLLLRTRQRTLKSADVEHDPGGRSGQRFRAGDQVVSVEIEDNGSGIAPEMLNQIFDPFFTTKETGSGTGLGLTVCRKVLELHGGTIDLANRAEGGTRVTILLKVA